MNLVERWFSALTTKKLRRSAHTSVKELAADITAWVDQWNTDPKPFAWHRSADEILTKLASYCAAITGNDRTPAAYHCRAPAPGPVLKYP